MRTFISQTKSLKHISFESPLITVTTNYTYLKITICDASLKINLLFTLKYETT
jgi:hypothetical protein